MSQLFQLIQNCLSPNNILRSSSEKEILEFCNQNLFQILSQLCNFIEEDNTPSDSRLFCGTFIKIIFSNDKYISIWNSFSSINKDLIKNKLLGCLASEKDDIKKTCSIAIAAIAKVEIPNGWNIINVICNTALHQNINYKITSLKTLQNIIDFIDKNLKKNEKQQILLSLTTNMAINENSQVIDEAVLGFTKIIPFIEDNFKNENEKNFMINSLLNILEPDNIIKIYPNENIQKDILICFIEICRNYTIYLQDIFINISKMIFRYFNCTNNILSTLAIELWTTVADYENEIKKNIITSKYQDIFYEYIIRIIKERNYSIETEEWTPLGAVILLLSSLVKLGNKKILEKMYNYISECLNNELVRNFDNNKLNFNKNEKIKALLIKENAFLLYRAILFNNNLNSDIIKSSLQKIINELKNIETISIGYSIAYCLIIISKFHLDKINESQAIFDDFICQMLQLLEFHIKNKKILQTLCLCLKHVIKKSNKVYFNKHLTNLLTILIKIAYDKNSYNKDLNITQISMSLIGNLIEICEDIPINRNIIQMFFSDLYNKFENSLNINNFAAKEEQICYQDSILSIITSCCGEFQKITMNIEQIICVFNLIDKCLQQRGYIFEEGILAMSSLSFFGWDLFSNVNNNVMKYILFSLEERQNFALCYQGLLAADEIIRNVGKENLSNIPKIVEKIQKIIKDENIPRGLKIKCFALYSDIFNIDDKSNGDYLNDVLQLIVNAMNSSIDIHINDIDQDTLDYLSELREKIVELLTFIYYFLSSHNQINALSQYTDGFIKYLSKVIEPEFNSNIDLIAGVCGLLGDLSNYFKSSISLYFNQKSLKIMFDRLDKSSNPQHAEILNFSKQALGFLNQDYN